MTNSQIPMELNSEIADEKELQSFIAEIDAEMAACENDKIPAKISFRKYSRLERLQMAIHAEIAPIINAKREATLNVFFRSEDNYIPDDTTPRPCSQWFNTKASLMPE
jgi:hypothetical protein